MIASTAALPSIVEIDENFLYVESEIPTSLIEYRFAIKQDDWQKVQIFIFEEIERILKLNMIGKEIDALLNGKKNIYNLKNEMWSNTEFIHKISNHPIHIQDRNKTLSPSAFIPFCEFGGNMIGSRIDMIDYPICTSFRDKIFEKQLCYELDLNTHKKHFSYQTLKKGFTILIDENKDRFFSWNNRHEIKKDKGKTTKHKISFTKGG